MYGLKGKSFLTLHDYSSQQINYLLELAKELKMKKRMGIKGNLLEGKNGPYFLKTLYTYTLCFYSCLCR